MNTPENPRLIDCADVYGYDQNGDECIVGTEVRSDITLRDLFAAAAIIGFISEPATSETLARTCYRIADAMLAERENGGAK